MGGTGAMHVALAGVARLRALAETGLMGGASKPTLDRFVRLGRTALEIPVTAVSLVDDSCQFFASAAGLPDPDARTLPLSHSFCSHVVVSHEPLIFTDALEHPTLHDNPAIADLGVRAYAGFPITTDDGHVLGSFCAIDVEPREWTERELVILRDLAEGVGEVMDLLRRARRAEASESSLAALNARLVADDEDRSMATRAAVHDLRAPLSVMLLGVTNLLGHDASRSFPEIGKLLGMMKRNVDHAASLVSSMHDITRLAHGDVADGPLDVNAILQEVCDDLRPPAHITLHPPAMKGRVDVCGDTTALRRCLENLLSNAYRFAESQVDVDLRVDDEDVTITVEDDGSGLPDLTAYRRVWQPNVRFHIDEGRSGSGLGLSIVKEIIERFDGHVRARPSKALGGAKFSLRLPIVT